MDGGNPSVREFAAPAGDRLCALIRQVWLARGYDDVRPKVVRVGRSAEGRRPVSGIRSNLINGLPPGMAGRWRP